MRPARENGAPRCAGATADRHRRRGCVHPCGSSTIPPRRLDRSSRQCRCAAASRGSARNQKTLAASITPIDVSVGFRWYAGWTSGGARAECRCQRPNPRSLGHGHHPLPANTLEYEYLGTAHPLFPRFRALALFGRRPRTVWLDRPRRRPKTCTIADATTLRVSTG
jgi:hypothetical protein